MKTARRVEDIDPAFDPWEQSRPIPLFVLAIFIALAIWGALSYLDDLAPARSGEPGGLTADAPTPVQADAGAPLLD
ncbi:cytochrome c4, partial [Bordetella hinzii]